MNYTIKPTRRLSGFLIVLIRISIILNVILFAGSLFCDVFYLRDLEVEDNSGTHIFFVLLLWTYVFLTVVFMWLAEFASFMLWFARAYINMYKQQLGLTTSPRWAVLSWFIPIYNIVAPLILMRKLFAATNSQLARMGRTERLETRPLMWWWLMLVGESVLVVLILVLSFMKNSPELLLKIEFATLICSTISSILCIRILKSHTRIEAVLVKAMP